MIVRVVPVIAALAFVAAASLASAQQTPLVDQRQENQQDRIGQGITSEIGRAHV